MIPFRQVLRNSTNSRTMDALLNLFRDRFTESEALSPGAGFETNIYQILGFLAVPGLFVSLYLIPQFMELSFYKPGPAVDVELRADHLFFVVWSFTVVAFATIFEWDMLFPDRRDFLILTPFPIRLRDVFMAKLAALGLFLLAIVVAVNACSVVLLPIFSVYVKQARAAGVLRLMLTQIVAIGAAAAFAFFAAGAFQGLLINILTPRFFRRISPWLQMLGMSLLVLSLLLFPLYSVGLKFLVATHPDWLRFFPPYWFTGVYELLLPRPDPVFGLKAPGIAVALFCLIWADGLPPPLPPHSGMRKMQPGAAAAMGSLFRRSRPWWAQVHRRKMPSWLHWPDPRP